MRIINFSEFMVSGNILQCQVHRIVCVFVLISYWRQWVTWNGLFLLCTYNFFLCDFTSLSGVWWWLDGTVCYPDNCPQCPFTITQIHDYHLTINAFFFGVIYLPPYLRYLIYICLKTNILPELMKPSKRQCPIPRGSALNWWLKI